MVGTRRRLRIIGHGSSTRLRLVGDWDERPLDGVREARGVERALDKLLREQSLATGTSLGDGSSTGQREGAPGSDRVLLKSLARSDGTNKTVSCSGEDVQFALDGAASPGLAWVPAPTLGHDAGGRSSQARGRAWRSSSCPFAPRELGVAVMAASAREYTRVDGDAVGVRIVFGSRLLWSWL
jgi:hypothetical protein